MATQAQISINGTPGSDTDVPINTLVQLNNNGLGGETTWTWTIVDQPAGAADALSNPAIQNPTITPKKEGTYLLQLVVNAGIAGEKSDVQEFAIRELKSSQRIPAAQETNQASVARGWAEDVNALIKALLDSQARDDGLVCCVAAGALTVGDCVKLSPIAGIKVGLPGQEVVPKASSALATSAQDMRLPLGVFLGKVVGGGDAVLNDLVLVRTRGFLKDPIVSAGGTWTIGDAAYVTDAGGRAPKPGSQPRRIGRVIDTTGGASIPYLWLDGGQPQAESVELELVGALANGGPAGRRVLSRPLVVPKDAGGSQINFGTLPGAATTIRIDLTANGGAIGHVVVDEFGAAVWTFAARQVLQAGWPIVGTVNGNANGAADMSLSLLGA